MLNISRYRNEENNSAATASDSITRERFPTRRHFAENHLQTLESLQLQFRAIHATRQLSQEKGKLCKPCSLLKVFVFHLSTLSIETSSRYCSIPRIATVFPLSNVLVLDTTRSRPPDNYIFVVIDTQCKAQCGVIAKTMGVKSIFEECQCSVLNND
uniref:Uncharacterized protein n=1 Tax=Romanomermis culicivorax TaxID=13658 RepID=A0A915IWC3_ROMCU